MKFTFAFGAFVSSIIMAAPVQAGRTAIDANGGPPTILSGYCDFNGQDCVNKQLNYQFSFDGGTTFASSIGITGNGILTFGRSANFDASDPNSEILRDKILEANNPSYYVDDRREPALTDYGVNLISAGQNSELEFSHLGEVEAAGGEKARKGLVAVRPFIPQQLIDCIATGLEPTERELSAQAMHMWIDGAAERSASAWERLADDASERLFALRGARMALAGDNSR